MLNVLSGFPKYCNALINYTLVTALFAIHQKMKDIPRAFFQFSSKTLDNKIYFCLKNLNTCSNKWVERNFSKII